MTGRRAPLGDKSLIPAWHERAACAVVTVQDPALRSAWIADAHPLADEAKDICKTQCPVREICFRTALSDRSAQGILAGYDFDHGRMLKEDAILARTELGIKVPLTANRVRQRKYQGHAVDEAL